MLKLLAIYIYILACVRNEASQVVSLKYGQRLFVVKFVTKLLSQSLAGLWPFMAVDFESTMYKRLR